MTDWACVHERDSALDEIRTAKGQASVAGWNRCCIAASGRETAAEAYPAQFSVRVTRFVFPGRNAGQTKRPSGLSRRAFLRRNQYGASPDSAPGSAPGAAGTSASARLSLRTEFARTLQKMLNCAALAFLDLPFSRSYFELTSMPSTRTWSPLWRDSATDSPRRLNATTRCHSVLDCHSSFESFHDCCSGDGQNREVRSVAADLPLLRIFSEEADELDVIQIHVCFSFFCPISLGHPRAKRILLPRRAAAFWEGPERFLGRNRESRSREAAGRRNYPEAVPKKRSGGKGR